MTTNTRSALWAVDNVAISRGRLLTAGRALSVALMEMNQMVGYLDGATKPNPAYLELGMTDVQSQLLKAVKAMDMGPDLTPPETPIAKKDRTP